MYQFIHRGTLRILAERGREALAEHLHCRARRAETRRDSASKGAFTGAEGTGGQAERASPRCQRSTFQRAAGPWGKMRGRSIQGHVPYGESPLLSRPSNERRGHPWMNYPR